MEQERMAQTAAMLQTAAVVAAAQTAAHPQMVVLFRVLLEVQEDRIRTEQAAELEVLLIRVVLMALRAEVEAVLLYQAPTPTEVGVGVIRHWMVIRLARVVGLEVMVTLIRHLPQPLHTVVAAADAAQAMPRAVVGAKV